jgi:glutathione S-transferase
MRPWLALRHANIPFVTRTVEIPALSRQRSTGSGVAATGVDLGQRRDLGSITGLFPVLQMGELSIHESLAIMEWAAEHAPHAQLWPEAWQSRALARAICAEMASGFGEVRATMSCHLFGTVRGFCPNLEATRQLERLFEIWDACLQRSGGPYLFGSFSNADCMYFPMFTRLLTYGVQLDATAHRYGASLLQNPAVIDLIDLARSAPSISAYDEYIESMGGSSTARIRMPFVISEGD